MGSAQTATSSVVLLMATFTQIAVSSSTAECFLIDPTTPAATVAATFFRARRNHTVFTISLHQNDNAQHAPLPRSELRSEQRDGRREHARWYCISMTQAKTPLPLNHQQPGDAIRVYEPQLVQSKIRTGSVSGEDKSSFQRNGLQGGR